MDACIHACMHVCMVPCPVFPRAWAWGTIPLGGGPGIRSPDSYIRDINRLRADWDHPSPGSSRRQQSCANSINVFPGRKKAIGHGERLRNFQIQNYFLFKYHPDRTIGEWFDKWWYCDDGVLDTKKKNTIPQPHWDFCSDPKLLSSTFYLRIIRIYPLIIQYLASEKYESQIGSSSQHIMEKIMFQTTNQYMICIINYSHISPWYPHGWLNPNHFRLYNHGTFWKFTMFKKVVNHRTNWVTGPFCKLCVWSQRLPYRIYR